ncbi:MAG: sigma-54-dependent Fis family transcriptional regulator [Planctomycetota bacterium]
MNACIFETDLLFKMVLQRQIEQLTDQANGSRILPRLIELSLLVEHQREFLERAVELIEETTSLSEATVLLRGVKGTWRTLAASGTGEHTLPYELLAEALDQDQLVQHQNWVAIPLDFPNDSGRVLVQHYSTPSEPTDFASLTAALSIADSVTRHRLTPARRSERLSAILDLTARWNQSRETDQLLEEIAEAATRLLSAERASIFLPDSGGQQLIGKPALGVEGGQIQIPIGAGVVGAVIETGKPQRVDSDIADEQEQINREVDEALDFETKTLLCVPMKNSKGETIGAFELINRLQGNFTDEDQTALAELAAHAAVAIETTKHVEQLETTTKVVADEAADQVQLIGECGQIDDLKKTIERVAHTDLAILITGENGTGKEVVAQLIHYLSDRRDKVLVAVNCAAITESLLESELFGHEKGAFTDAHQTRIGKFELADQGTLFLDEIGDMSLGGQAKLLRVLEEKIVVRVGGSANISTSACIIAATNQDLAKLVQEKKFREDLFFRLNVVTLQIPPLRDRGDDILRLAEHFLKEFCVKARRSILKLSDTTKKKLLAHPWPGNVRELRNLMERLAYLSAGDVVNPDDLAFVNSPRGDDAAIPMDQTLADATKQFQCDYIRRHIERSGGNMTEAASKLGLHRSNLYRKMRQLDMSEGDGETEAGD